MARTFALVATCSCGAADSGAISITAPQLMSLRITPRTASIQAGAQQQFGVTANWSTGASTLPPVSYSVVGGSMNGTVNSVTGVYTAPGSAGTYRVVVAHTGGTLRDTATITVQGETPSPPSSGGVAPAVFTPNLPGGMSLVTDTYFGNLLSGERLNGDGLAHAWDGRNATDDNAPFGPQVYEMFYAGNIRSNGDGGGILFGEGGRRWRRMYFALMMWVPANYSMHSNEEKFFYPLVMTNGRQTSATIFGWYVLGGETPSSPTWSLGYDAQIGNGRVHPPHGVRMRKGVWQHVEYYVEMNTPGRQDGVWRVWIDGQLAVNLTSARFSNAGAQSVFDGIRFTGTRGGGQSTALTPPGGQVRRFSRLAFYASER